MAQLRYQPQGRVKIDRSNPITRGMIFAHTPTTLRNNLEKVTPFGIAGQVPTVVPEYRDQPANVNMPEVTVMGIGMRNGTLNGNNSQFLMRYRNGGNSNTTIIGLGLDNYSNSRGISFYTSYPDYSSQSIRYDLPTNSNGQMLMMIGTYSTSVNVANLWTEGKVVATGPAPNKLATAYGTAFMSDAAGGTNNTGLPTLLSVMWLRTLSDNEIKSLFENPWQIFESPREDEYDGPLGAGGVPASYTMSAALGTFAAGYIPTGLKKGSKIVAATNPYLVSGINAGVLNNRRVYAQSYAVSMPGINTNLLSSRKISAQTGSQINIYGNANNVLYGRKVYAQVGSNLSVTGISTGLISARKVYAQTSVPVALTAAATKLLTSRRILAQASDLIPVTASTARLLNGKRVYAQTTPFNLGSTTTGLIGTRKISAQASPQVNVVASDAKLLNARKVYAQTASISGLGSNSARLLNNKKVFAQTSSATISSINAGLKADRKLVLNAGVVPAVGFNISLLVGSKSMFSIASGQYAFSSTAAGLKVSRKLVLNTSGYTLVSSNARVLVGRKIISTPNAMILTDVSTRLVASRKLSVDSTGYTVGGSNLLTRFFRRISAGVDNFAVSGSDTKLKMFLRLGAASVNLTAAFGNASTLVKRKLKALNTSFAYTFRTASLDVTRNESQNQDGGTVRIRKRFRNMFKSL